MAAASSQRVLIAGGGIAALELLLALRSDLPERVPVTLLAPQADFVVRASSVLEPFGRGEARRIPLESFAAEHHADVVADALLEVDATRSLVITRGGRELEYGRLAVALGAVPESPFPGATVFAGPQDRDAVTGVLEAAESGEIARLAFAVPAGATWALPAYELALLTREHLCERGAGAVEVLVVTPEPRPLSLFGEAASAELEARLDAAGIEAHTLSRVRSHDGGRLELEGGGHLRADRVVSLPRLKGPALAGLPHDDEGFIPVDDHGRVRGVDGVYAAGDCTAFPMKQGGLAAQQADAVAESIAFDLGAAVEATPFTAVLRGLLLTGDTPIYLRAWPGAGREPSSVAIEATGALKAGGGESVASETPLWWPPSKIAGRHLGAWLMRPRSHRDAPDELADRATPGESDPHAQERSDAMELALMMADGEAGFGDFHAAVRALEAAETLTGSLPPEYQQKRRMWLEEIAGSPSRRYSG